MIFIPFMFAVTGGDVCSAVPLCFRSCGLGRRAQALVSGEREAAGTASVFVTQ